MHRKRARAGNCARMCVHDGDATSRASAHRHHKHLHVTLEYDDRHRRHNTRLRHGCDIAMAGMRVVRFTVRVVREARRAVGLAGRRRRSRQRRRAGRAQRLVKRVGTPDSTGRVAPDSTGRIDVKLASGREVTVFAEDLKVDAAAAMAS